MSAEFANDGRGRVPTLWLVGAKEFLDAVAKLAIEGAENEEQIRQTKPVLILLAYAFEQIFEAEMRMRSAEPGKHHNLLKSWEQSKATLEPIVENATKFFVDKNRNSLGSHMAAVLVMDPNFGEPQRSFFDSLSQLDKWTNRPFLARYPETGVMFDGTVDIAYLHFVGCCLQETLMKKALARNSVDI